MNIRCVKCNEIVTVPEEVLKSGKLRFICHLCNTAQEIKTIRIMQEKAGKLSMFYAERHIADHDLFVGINTVGRTSEEKKTVEFSGDEYLSRQHFIIEVRKNDKHDNFEYLAYFNKVLPRNKTIIISGKEKRELKSSEKIILSNEDKIVAGKTTFILTADTARKRVTGTELA